MKAEKYKEECEEYQKFEADIIAQQTELGKKIDEANGYINHYQNERSSLVNKAQNLTEVVTAARQRFFRVCMDAMFEDDDAS